MVTRLEQNVRQVPYSGRGANPVSFSAEPAAVRGGTKWFDTRCVRCLSDFQPIYPTFPEDIEYLYSLIGLVDAFLGSTYRKKPIGSKDRDFGPLANEYWGDRPPTVLSIGTGLGAIDFNAAQALTMGKSPSDIRIITTNLTPDGHKRLERISPSISRKLEKWSGSGVDIVEEMNRHSMQVDIVIATRSMSGISGIPYKEFLSGCAKILRKGGVLVSDVFTANMRKVLEIAYPNGSHDDNTYYNNEYSLATDLKNCGFNWPFYDDYCHVPGMLRYSMIDTEKRQQLAQKLRENKLLEEPTHIMFLAVKK